MILLLCHKLKPLAQLNSNKNYRINESYVLRTPLYPIQWSKCLLEKKNIADFEVLELLSDRAFEKSIFIASHALHKRLILWKEGKINDEKQISRLKLSVIKYAIRISTRCTPFGLFSGCSVGKFTSKTNIQLDDCTSHKLAIRPSYGNLHNKVRYMEKHWEKLHLFANNSLFSIGNDWRYLERHKKDDKFHFTMEQIKGGGPLDLIIKQTKRGATFSALLALLENKGFGTDDAKVFLSELIENQIIEYSIYPPLIRDEFNYSSIAPGINGLQDLKGDSKNFQYDLFISANQNSLNTELKERVWKVFGLFQKIARNKQNEKLNRFRTEFKKRFGDEEVSLPQAIDPEYGIDYLNSHSFIGDSILLDELDIKSKPNQDKVLLEWDRIHVILNEKIQKAQKEGQFEINLQDTDFEDFKVPTKNFPSSIFSILELIRTKDQDKIYVGPFIGSSAAKIIARFGYGNSEIQDIIDEIVGYENSALSDNEILAEIVHLPSLSAANISRRTVKREYEIPYLGFSKKPIENQLLVDDLMLSIKNDKLILRSKSLNKTIIPILTNMHSYTHSPVPIYQFLSDFIDSRYDKIYGFTWGKLKSIHHFLPRVVYRGVIISKARWMLRTKDIEGLLPDVNDQEFEVWRAKNKIPSFINMVEGDNKLLLNLKNRQCQKILISMVRKEKWVELEEFLSDNNQWVVDKHGKSYANEVILFFNRINDQV